MEGVGGRELEESAAMRRVCHAAHLRVFAHLIRTPRLSTLSSPSIIFNVCSPYARRVCEFPSLKWNSKLTKLFSRLVTHNQSAERWFMMARVQILVMVELFCGGQSQGCHGFSSSFYQHQQFPFKVLLFPFLIPNNLNNSPFIFVPVSENRAPLMFA